MSCTALDILHSSSFQPSRMIFDWACITLYSLLIHDFTFFTLLVDDSSFFTLLIHDGSFLTDWSCMISYSFTHEKIHLWSSQEDTRSVLCHAPPSSDFTDHSYMIAHSSVMIIHDVPHSALIIFSFLIAMIHSISPFEPCLPTVCLICHSVILFEIMIWITRLPTLHRAFLLHHDVHHSSSWDPIWITKWEEDTAGSSE